MENMYGFMLARFDQFPDFQNHQLVSFSLPESSLYLSRGTNGFRDLAKSAKDYSKYEGISNLFILLKHHRLRE
jgi:hypothetical protein